MCSENAQGHTLSTVRPGINTALWTQLPTGYSTKPLFLKVRNKHGARGIWNALSSYVSFIRWKVPCVNLCVYMNCLWYSFSSHHMGSAEEMNWAQTWGSAGEKTTSLSFLSSAILIPIYYSLFLHLSLTLLLTGIILACIWNFPVPHISNGAQ